MCYKKPGPRCSSHAKEALMEAYASKDVNKVRQALIDYLHTPAGIEETAETNPAYAATLRDEREAMIENLAQQERSEAGSQEPDQSAIEVSVNDFQSPYTLSMSEDEGEGEIPQSPGFVHQVPTGEPIVGRDEMVSHVQSGNIRLGEYVNLQLDGYYGQKFEVTGSLQKDDDSDRIYVLDNKGTEYEVYSSMNNNFTPHVFTGFRYLNSKDTLTSAK